MPVGSLIECLYRIQGILGIVKLTPHVQILSKKKFPLDHSKVTNMAFGHKAKFGSILFEMFPNYVVQKIKVKG